MNTSMKDTVIALLSEVNRNGIENLIQFIKDSDYLTSARCYSHHQCPEGLMMHSLEVLDNMLKNNISGMPRESLILVALCHDLGKARLNGKMVGNGDHTQRSIEISTAFVSPLLILLQFADCRSTGINKRGEKYRFSVL